MKWEPPDGVLLVSVNGETKREKDMRITDYETQRTLKDVGITLTLEEADELCAYLHRLRSCPQVKHVHLSQIVGDRLEREVTFALGS